MAPPSILILPQTATRTKAVPTPLAPPPLQPRSQHIVILHGMSEALPEPTAGSSVPAPALPPPPAAQERIGGAPPPRLGAAPAGLGGPSLQRVAKVYASTAEAIAHFKPTPREVISGIAPHVFDERKRRRGQHRVAAKPYWYAPGGQKRSSPLRGATLISWDEHSIYLGTCGRPPTCSLISMSITKRHAAPEYTEQPDIAPEDTADDKNAAPANPEAGGKEKGCTQASAASQHAALQKRATKHSKSGWRYFRVDIHLLK